MMAKITWDYPEEEVARGTNLSFLEELDIGQTPRPVKTDKTSSDEHELHQLRADTVKSPHDKIPIQLHTARVDLRGVPDYSAVFDVYLSGESADGEVMRRLLLIVAEMETQRRVIWAVLVEYYRYARSEEEIASELFLSQKTVSRMIRKGTDWIRARYMALYGEDD